MNITLDRHVLTQSVLRQIADYDSGTGVFRIYEQPVTKRSRRGEAYATINDKRYSVAALAFLYVLNHTPQRICRIDGDHANDVWANLFEPPERPSELSADVLRQLAEYDPDTGIFRIRGKTRSSKCVSINGLRYRPHQLAWLYMTGTWSKQLIVHLDGNKTNNRWVNLREYSSSQKLRYQHTARGDMRGVYAKGRSWAVVLRNAGQRTYYGSFKSLEEAIAKSAEVRAKRDVDLA